LKRACSNFPRRAVLAHVIRGQERKAGVRPAGAVGIDRIAGELAEVGEREAEGIDVVGIAGEAGNDVGVARLHRSSRAAKRDDAARAAKGHVVEPARRKTEVLSEADGCVRREGEAGHREAIDVVLLQA